MLEAGESAPRIEKFALGPALGQCCGGTVSLLIEPFACVAWNVWIFGAGHVGLALVHQLAGLPAKVVLVDAREAQFPAALPANATRRWTVQIGPPRRCCGLKSKPARVQL
jgi:xanthine dehydrogenase accessory factor